MKSFSAASLIVHALAMLIVVTFGEIAAHKPDWMYWCFLPIVSLSHGLIRAIGRVDLRMESE